VLLAIAVAISVYVHTAADRVRSASVHGDEPALIVSLPIASRFLSAEERHLLYSIGDDIQARNAAAIVDIGVRHHRMYLRLAATDVDAATEQIREVLRVRGLIETAAIETL
jgi:hypothetical protein